MIALFRKINRCLEPRDQIEERRVDRSNRPGERALQLIERCPRLQRRYGVDEIRDGLRLHQIDAAVEKRAQRELARFGQPGPRAHRRRHDGVQNDRAAVRAQFDEIVSRVGSRRRESRSRRPGRSLRRSALAQIGRIRLRGWLARRARATIRSDRRIPITRASHGVARMEPPAISTSGRSHGHLARSDARCRCRLSRAASRSPRWCRGGEHCYR